MSRADVKQLGELIDTGQAALVMVGESTVQSALDKAGLKAEKHVAKELDDVSSNDIDQAVQEAAKEASWHRQDRSHHQVWSVPCGCRSLCGEHST